jgi:hypothetical protein
VARGLRARAGDLHHAQSLVDESAAPVATALAVAPDSVGVVGAAWATPPGNLNTPARVYVRPRGDAILNDLVGRDSNTLDESRGVHRGWTLVHQGPSQTVRLHDLIPGVEYEVAIVLQSRNGGWAQPGAVVQVVTPEEFPNLVPEPVGSLTGRALFDGGYELSWTASRDSAPYDYVEIRRGAIWHGAEVVGRTKDDRYVVPDIGHGVTTFLVATRAASGQYSRRRAHVTDDLGGPRTFTEQLVTLPDLDPDANGTLDGVEIDPDHGGLRLVVGAYQGTYTTETVDAGAAGRHLWSLNWHGWEQDVATAWDDPAGPRYGTSSFQL